MEEIINNWARNRGQLKNLGEDELKTLMSLERKRKPYIRETVIVAIHQRQSKLRTERERAKLIDAAQASKAKADAAAAKAKERAARS